MNNYLKVVILACAVTFVGCDTLPKVRPIDITTDVREIETLHPPLPTSVTWQKVEWVVLTPDIMRELLAKVDSGEIDDSDAVFAGLTSDHYENLSLNLADLKRYIADQKSIIVYYREIPEELLEEAEEVKAEEEPQEDEAEEVEEESTE